MNWTIPPKPAELTEKRLIEAILDGVFPVNSNLPGERALAELLGVTRPTLREAMQRLARDGWLEINQGKPTRVRDYWREGNLGVLATITRYHDHLPENFICNLLFVRQLMAPTYARLAVECKVECLIPLLEELTNLPDNASAYASADWDLHYQLTVCSGNPIFTLILNGFKELYPVVGKVYFQSHQARSRSKQFYQDLLVCARTGDAQGAHAVTDQVMRDSLEIWCQVTGGQS